MWPKPEIRPIRFDGDVAYVTLTQGYIAVIDAADAHLVDQCNWNAVIGRHGHVYATRAAIIDGRKTRVRMHRHLLGCVTSSDVEVDHRDCDPLNNRRNNLRLASKSQNAGNSRKRKHNKNGLKGVTWHKKVGKWQASIFHDGRSIYLGLFSLKEQAHEAYKREAVRIHGEFARAA